MKWLVIIAMLAAFLFWLRKRAKLALRSKSSLQDSEDIIKGYRFIATLQLRTPLRVLEHHGKTHPGPEANLPKYGDLANGIWLPETESWAELGMPGIKEVPNGTMASDIGEVPSDGGKYLKFLKAFRRIVETNVSPEEKREAIKSLPKEDPEYKRFLKRHEEMHKQWLDYWLGYDYYLGIPGIKSKIAKALYDAGFRSKEDLRKAEDNRLMKIKGIGPETVKQIRKILSG